LLQSVCAAAQVVVHTPEEHTSLAWHLVPHAPQLVGSLCVWVHTPRQRSPPLGHWHWPAWQVVPPAQRTPQPPQFRPSVCWFTQPLVH
jgi:hypothetical protein